jgi:hypothetical protein
MTSPNPRLLEARIAALEIQVKALMALNQTSASPDSTYTTPLDPDWPITAEPHDDWFPVWHVRREGEPLTGCGNVAYYIVRQIQFSEKFDHTLMRIQGSDGFWGPPQLTEVPRCSSCCLPIDPRSPAELDFSQARVPPPTAPEALEPRARKPRVNTRRSRPAQEVRVSQSLARPGGGSSPGPSDLPPEPTLPAAFTPEAQAEVVDSINRLAKEMGLHG